MKYGILDLRWETESVPPISVEAVDDVNVVVHVYSTKLLQDQQSQHIRLHGTNKNVSQACKKRQEIRIFNFLLLVF